MLKANGIGDVSADAWSSRYEVHPTAAHYDVIAIEAIGDFDRVVEQTIDREFQRPFAETSCPVRFIWIEESKSREAGSKSRRRAIVVTYRHAIADGRAIQHLCQQLLAACRGKQTPGSLHVYEGDLFQDLKRGVRPPGVWGFFRMRAANWWEWCDVPLPD